MHSISKIFFGPDEFLKEERICFPKSNPYLNKFLVGGRGLSSPPL